ncbi:MAG: glycosyltransferase, partial [Mycobacteriales bacterium]
FLLFVGTLEPRKDVASLVTAFASIAGSHEDLSLVVAGGRGWRDQALQAALSAAGPCRERAVFTGYVPDDAVPALLRRAAAVAYPSLSEGYGLPALEAMACGAPLVTTSGTAMAEVAGDAAVLVPPGDVDALAGALSDLLAAGRDDPGVLARRATGLDRAAARTWAGSAERHVEAYRIAAGLR